MITERDIQEFLHRLYASTLTDASVIRDNFQQFLDVSDEPILYLMNHSFFVDQYNLIRSLRSLHEDSAKANEDIRKEIYKFLSEYITINSTRLMDYMRDLCFQIVNSFRKEQTVSLKQAALDVLATITHIYDEQIILTSNMLDPLKLHEEFINILKTTNIQPSIRAESWFLLSTIQSKFSRMISSESKQQVQTNCMIELKKHVKENKNLSSIAALLRSFTRNLNENYLKAEDLITLYTHATVLMIPLERSNYQIPKAAIQLLTQRITIFQPIFMENCDKARKIFNNCLMVLENKKINEIFSIEKVEKGDKGDKGEDKDSLLDAEKKKKLNKDIKLKILELMVVLVEQFTVGINANGAKFRSLFQYLLEKMNSMLQCETQYDKNKNLTLEEKKSGNLITAIRILGILSPLYLKECGMEEYKKFFSHLMKKCKKKIKISMFDKNNTSTNNEEKSNQNISVILYNQKQLTSFLVSISKMVEQLDDIDYEDASNLEMMFLSAIKEYPYYHQNYKAALHEGLALFIMGMYSKPAIFSKWIKKIVSQSLKESLDCAKYHISNDDEYYRMIQQSSLLWVNLLSQSVWRTMTLRQFSETLFQNMEYLMLNLDCSYRTNIQSERMSDDVINLDEQGKQEANHIVNIFYLSDEIIHINKIQDFQFLSNIVLLYAQLLKHIDFFLYSERIASFYHQVIFRLRVYNKSIPLMKTLRVINAFIIKFQWIYKQQSKQQSKRQSKQQSETEDLQVKMVNFFHQINDNIFKYQEQYFYEALKMLLSMPNEVYFKWDGQIMKHHLPVILKKSLELGQQIITLADAAIECISRIFQYNSSVAQKYLENVVPYLEKYITTDNTHREETKTYVFLDQIQINRESVGSKVMNFLGSIGGISHLLIDNKTKDYVSWDYQCKLQVEICLLKDKPTINLTKLLSRTCWLAINGKDQIKIIACQFLHSNVTYVIGLAVDNKMDGKQNLSKFLDKVLPTMLNISANTSHPSQQLIHTLLIQSIHFFANTKQQNSPDIQTILKHILMLYNGAEDMSYLASKCLSEFVKWHIRQQIKQQSDLPILKALIRNIWSLISNKKAKDGLVQLLLKLLIIIHRNENIMALYALQLGSLIISLSRSNKPISEQFQYLIEKYSLTLKMHLKKLIIDQDIRKYQKFPNIQIFLEWLYKNCFFSIHSQQRQVSFMIWYSIVTKYSQVLGFGQVQFLKSRASKEKRYLFANCQEVQFDIMQQLNLKKCLSKITALGQIWIRLLKYKIFQPIKLIQFKDLECVYISSFCKLVQYLDSSFLPLAKQDRLLAEEEQQQLVESTYTFIDLLQKLQTPEIQKKFLSFLQYKLDSYSINLQKVVEIFFLLYVKPTEIVPNFNVDLVLNSSSNKSNIIHKLVNLFQLLYGQHTIHQFYLLLNKYYHFQTHNQIQLLADLFLNHHLNQTDIQLILNCIVQVYQADQADRHSHQADTHPQHQADYMMQQNQKRYIIQPERQYNQHRCLWSDRYVKIAIDLLQQRHEEISSDSKRRMLIQFVLQFNRCPAVKDFIALKIADNHAYYQKYEKLFLNFVIKHNKLFMRDMVELYLTTNIQYLKLFPMLVKKVTPNDLKDMFQIFQLYIRYDFNEITSEIFIKDILMINFIFVDKFDTFTERYIRYLDVLVENSLKLNYSIEIHEEALNLAAVIINKCNINNIISISSWSFTTFMKMLRVNLTSLQNRYVPLCISKLPSPQSKNKCIQYLKAIRNMIIISQDFRFIDQFFPTFKDPELNDYYTGAVAQLIDDCIRECFARQRPEQQKECMSWLLQLFWDQDLDKDEWQNYRLLIVDKIIRKAMKFVNLDLTIEIFYQHADKLIHIISQPLTNTATTIKTLVLSCQIKKAAFIILENLYFHLPKPDKENKACVHKNQRHKTIIKICQENLKIKITPLAYAMMIDHDQKQKEFIKKEDQRRKQDPNFAINNKKYSSQFEKNSLEVYREMVCSAYNCLIIIFISTQSNKEHFKSFIFEHSKEILWDNLIDPEKKEYGFEIETEFRMMRPIESINRGDRSQIKQRIKDKYLDSSLYVIEEENIPENMELKRIKQQNEDEEDEFERERKREGKEQLEAVIINKKVNSAEIEEDVINRHPCMINLLRVIDHLHNTFYDGTFPTWMGPINTYLKLPTCTLGVRIFLIKLIINRPNVFSQDVWAKHLLQYLQLEINGGKFIHYFYRDALKLFIKMIKVEGGYRPKESQQLLMLNRVVKKLIRCLPHDENNFIYSDNIDMLEQLFKLDGVYIEKEQVILKMLESEIKAEPKKKYQWRMCAVLVLKMALIHAVPVINQKEFPTAFHKGHLIKYQFYYQMMALGYFKFIKDMTNDLVKKWRITAAGFLPEYLIFIFKSVALSVQEKQKHFKFVAQFLCSINQRENTRDTKQRFTLTLLYVSQRFPQILSDSKLFQQTNTCLIQYNKEQRSQILQSLTFYCKYQVTYSESGSISNIFMNLRSNCSQILGDTFDVKRQFIVLLHCCSNNFLLRVKDIIETYDIICEMLERVYSQITDESVALVYYQMVIKIKIYLRDPETIKFGNTSAFLHKLHQIMIKGLGSQFKKIRELLLSQFEKNNVCGNMQGESVDKIISIWKQMYCAEHEQLWLVNAIPLVLSLARTSSDYNRVLFTAKLEDTMQYYDWDFRNFKLANSSLPYTPAFTNTNVANKQIYNLASMGGSLSGDKLRGMIRASNTAYMSQEQQIFTMLSSSQNQHPYEGSQISSQESLLGSYPSKIEDMENQSNPTYSKINSIFLKNRKRNVMMDSFKESNTNKYSPSVRIVEDKLRFRKNTSKHINIPHHGRKIKIPQKAEINLKGVLLRKYKIGELPNIEISLQNIIDPVIYLAQFDYEFASELFLQVFQQVCRVSIKSKSLMKDLLQQFLLLSKKHEFNFISTVEKGMINLCQRNDVFFNLSIKNICFSSNTLDYGIIFTEENIIQSLKHANVHQSQYIQNALQSSQAATENQWQDLLDYYQHINQDQIIYGIIFKILQGEEKQHLKDVLQSKQNGDIKKSKEIIELIIHKTNNYRIQKFLEKEKIDCSALLSEWDQIKNQMSNKISQQDQQKHLSEEEMKILLISLQNLDINEQTKNFTSLIDFQSDKYSYEISLKSILEHKFDNSRYYSSKTTNIFKREWQKTSELAFNSKHSLLSNLQKNYELFEFLELEKKFEIDEKECVQLFNKWAKRSPNDIYDNNFTWVQILSSRLMFGKYIKNRWNINDAVLAKSNTEWLLQVINGMLKKGALGYAENVTRKALTQHKLAKGFSWQFYESISKLKLLQLLRKENINLSDYEVVPRLIKKQMSLAKIEDQYSQLKLSLIENQYLEGFLYSNLQSQVDTNSIKIGEKITQVYINYQTIKKSIKLHTNTLQNIPNVNFNQFKKNIHFKFSLFLETILSNSKGKFEKKQIQDYLISSNLSYEKICCVFAEEIIESIKLVNLSKNYEYDENQQLFSLILKLLKIVQLEHKKIGKYFEEAVNETSIPKWIFLYFIPQIIRTLNSFDLAPYFKDLFEIILASYPQSLIYHFNCSYPRRKDCFTPTSQQIYDQLHKKMETHFKFIQNLHALQHPELRLKDILQKFLVPGETDTALLELKEFIDQKEFLGKYNKKFIEDWKKKIQMLMNLRTNGNSKDFETQHRKCMNNLDTSKKEVIESMKLFSKVTDGSTFFEEYNSSDWPRIEVPGTSYCRFEEPLPWNKVYIESFDHTLLTLNSIRKPKRITILGSNQKNYMLLVKAGEDVRLDQRIQELFDLVNRIFKNSCETSKKQVQIKRFEVVPMKKMLGVFQWVDQSQTLRQFLEVQYKELKTPQHNLTDKNDGFTNFIEYFKRICPGVTDKYSWHKSLLMRSEEQVVKNLVRSENGIPYGLLRFALQRLSKNFDSFLHIKNRFLSNYAGSCLISYILGIGDRHLDNFLIQSSTASLVMIDFGYSFGASVDLSIPELIPFRLTKVFKELSQPIGYEGTFKRCMVSCFEALSKRVPLIVDYCDVFIDDPLMEWVWVSRRQLGVNINNVEQPPSNHQQSFSVTQQPPEKKIFSKKIDYVAKKLKGYNPRALLEEAINDSRHKNANYRENLKKAIWGKCKNKEEVLATEDLINELISLATDKNIMGRSYIGLNMYI